MAEKRNMGQSVGEWPCNTSPCCVERKKDIEEDRKRKRWNGGGE